jgi:hypothetical protein
MSRTLTRPRPSPRCKHLVRHHVPRSLNHCYTLSALIRSVLSAVVSDSVLQLFLTATGKNNLNRSSTSKGLPVTAGPPGIVTVIVPELTGVAITTSVAATPSAKVTCVGRIVPVVSVKVPVPSWLPWLHNRAAS